MTSSCNECPLGSATLPERCPFHASTRGAGELLIRQGEVPSAALFVKQGAVLVSSVGPTGEETSCAMRGAGALLGLELLTSAPSRYQVSALSAATVCTLSASGFSQWMGDLGPRPAALFRMMLGEADLRYQDRARLSGKPVARLARFLIERDRGRDASAHPPKAIRGVVLARMLGMRPETLSRAIGALRTRGVVGRGRALEVLDAPRLAAIAEET